jgi:hypothetical protein
VDQSIAYVRWYDEDEEGAGGRRVKAAWLVRDVAGAGGDRQQVLAYLGRRPVVTSTLQEELAALYPEVSFPWDAIRRALSAEGGLTNVAALTDDELALGLRALARERGMSLMDLSLRLGYRQRQVLPELVALLQEPGNVARFERTSGSVFDYMAERHPEYAYLLYKARLFFEGEEAGLAATVAAEPAGFGDTAWRVRRQFWRERLQAYRLSRRRPPALGAEL